MRDAFALIDDLNHRHTADRPGIEGLPPGRGIKGGAVQVSGSASARSVDHAGTKLAEIAIVVIKPFGHRDTAIVAERARVPVDLASRPYGVTLRRDITRMPSRTAPINASGAGSGTGAVDESGIPSTANASMRGFPS